ncbi:MAG: DUF6391 domain-containing protein [Anaerolineaceae bacterium]
MSGLNSLLSLGPVSHVRRNHALEHATLQVLSRTDPFLRLAGYSNMGGFWVVGEISTDMLAAAVQEAVARLRAGEIGLAIHPNCGTNFVTTGFLAGIAGWLGMLGVGRGLRRKLERLPVIIGLVTLAIILANPLGPLLQAKVTTQPDIGNLEVVRIERGMRQQVPIHRVVTKG